MAAKLSGVLASACVIASGLVVLAVPVSPAGADPTTTYGWAQTAALPTGSGNNVLIACPSTGYCWGTTGYWNEVGYIVGGPSYVLTTSDDGASWSNSPIGQEEESSGGTNPVSDNQYLQPSAVTCVPGTSTCYFVAAASQVYPTKYVPSEFEFIDSNSDFQPGDLGTYISDTNSAYYGDAVNFGVLGGLTCPAIDQCDALGTLGVHGESDPTQIFNSNALFQETPSEAAWTDNGPADLTDTGISTEKALSCTSTTLCWVAGSDNVDTPGGPELDVLSGVTWSKVATPDPYAAISQLTCLPGADPSDRSEATCYAYVNDGGPEFFTSTDGGSTWNQGNIVDANNRGIELPANTGIHGITCPTTTACLAFGESSNGTGELLVTINGGQSWTPETVPGSTTISSASCPSVIECYLGGGLSDTAGAVWTSTDLGLAEDQTQPVTALQATGGLDSASATWTAPDVAAGFGAGAPYSQFHLVASPQGAGSTISDTVDASQTGDTLYGLTAGLTYDIAVTPGNTSNGTFVPSGPADDVLVVPTQVAESSPSSSSGTNPTPSTVSADGSTVSSTSVGTGTVTIGTYPSDPEGGLAAGTSFFDVAASGSFTSVSVKDCSSNVALPLTWWNSADQAWEPVSPAATLSAGCLHWQATTTSTPSVSELYGTPFAASSLTAPAAPLISSALSGKGSAVLHWKAPSSNGGSPITKYLVTSTPGSKTCSSTSATTCTVTGLTDGTKYTFEVKAKNAIGTGPASAPSAVTVPGKNGPATITMTISAAPKVAKLATITVSVAKTVTGKIGVSAAGSPIAGCTAISITSGKATCKWTPTSAASTPVVATYRGSVTWGSASKTAVVVVKS
jgi:hypothetical protein